MNQKKLDIEFEKAVQSINEHTEPFPADILLKLYAYYKRATNSNDPSESSKPLISAFKTNALFQTRDISENQAKQHYIDIVTNYFLWHNGHK